MLGLGAEHVLRSDRVSYVRKRLLRHEDETWRRQKCILCKACAVMLYVVYCD